MKSFGIGLALAMSGFACYLLSDEAVKLVTGMEGMEELSAIFAMVWPWLCLTVVVIGIGWFWILSPLLNFTKPYPEEPRGE